MPQPKHIISSTLRRLTDIFGTDPCLIHLFLNYLQQPATCSEIFSLITMQPENICYKQRPTHYYRKTLHNQDFQPCSHTGPCVNNKSCGCYIRKTYCERSCQCERCNLVMCCSCTKCDASCPCFSNSRECMCHKHCDNQVLFKHKCIETYIGPSYTSGFGLFADENIECGKFVIEYVGEAISYLESERRGVFYDQKKISYLFGLRTESESVDTIDATRIGNNARFINHSINANLVAKQISSAGITKIGFYTKRDVRKDEELFFDYKYNDQIKENYLMKD